MNAVIEKFGGVRWQKAAIAVELIERSTGCSKEHAREALDTWVNDSLVKARDIFMRKPSLSLDSLASRVALSLARGGDRFDFFEVEMIELRGLLERSSAAPASRVERATKPKRAATQLPDVTDALRELYPKGAPTPNREAIRAAVIAKLGRDVSLSTIDRARKEVWPTA